MNANEPSRDAMLARALEIKGREAARLRSYPNVTGVGVGFREVRGKPTGEVALRVYVSKKVPPDRLAAHELLPSILDGVPVDVIEARFRIHDSPADHQRRHQLLRSGISIGNLITTGSGTLGASVFDDFSGQQMVLSNWHVLCGRQDCQVGEPIVQPGTGGGDGGNAGDLVARLARWQLDDEVDAAVAFLSGHRFLTDEQLNLGRLAIRSGIPSLGLHVTKSGRSTGVSDGHIVDVSADVEVDYGGSIGVRQTRNQLSIKNGDQIVASGDSGSVWVDDEMRAVGLTFSGSDDGTTCSANNIDLVIAALHIGFGPGVTLQDFVVQAASL